METGSTEVDFRRIREARPTASDAWLPITEGWMCGRSLPFVAIHEPEKFYLAYVNGDWPRELAAQAAEVTHRASRIRIPRPLIEGWLVSHSIDRWGCYEGFRFTRKCARTSCFRYFIDEAWLNLFLPCGGCELTRSYSAKMSESFFREFGGGRRHWDQARCERFFSNKKNFISDEFEVAHEIL